jgi:hypothetical protein
MPPSHTEKTLEDEARQLVQGSPERFGPGVITDRADALYDAIVPTALPVTDPWAGRELLTRAEAQISFGLATKAMDAAIRRGDVLSLKIGRRRMFPIVANRKHFEAIAYAESGAMDAWEAALVRASAARLRRVRRQAWGKRKTVRRKLREARRRQQELQATEGAPREMAVETLTVMQSVQAELTAEQALATGMGDELAKDIETVAKEFGIDLETMKGPRLGLGPKP